MVLNGMRADLLLFKAVGGDGVVYRLLGGPKESLKLEARDDLMGMRGAGIGSAVFDGVNLNKSEALAPSDAMLRVDSTFHLGLAAIAVGICQAALEAATKYAKERKQFGQTISSYDMVQDMLAEMATRTHASRLMLYDATGKCDTGKPCGKESAMTKAYAAQSATCVTRFGVQIHGGYGYIKDYAIERMFRDAKVTEVLGGTTEALRLDLARSML
jgi:butyryl-CoA dehydrogenase